MYHFVGKNTKPIIEKTAVARHTVICFQVVIIGTRITMNVAGRAKSNPQV